MLQFFSYLINGISLGSVYAIIALGYSMVYGIAKMLNFAHGDVIMIGAYIAFCATQYWGMSPLLGVLIAMIVCTVLGMVIERLAYKPLRQATSLAVLITAIGVSYLLQNLALLVFGPNPMSFPSFVSIPSISLFDGQLILTGETIVTVLANIIIMLVLTFFTSHTKMGKAMRAVSEDRSAAELMGNQGERDDFPDLRHRQRAGGDCGRAALLHLPHADAHDGFHAGHQGVHGGCFRRHRINSRRAAGRPAAGHH